eukprot:scaffold22562_cov153-Cylindrotheca_fusiformis.AAC.2
MSGENNNNQEANHRHAGSDGSPLNNNDDSSCCRIQIVSASYGPCEGLRLSTGEWSSDDSASIPITRDVGQQMRALLVAARRREEKDEEISLSAANASTDEKSPQEVVRFQTSGKSGSVVTRPFIFVLGNGGKFGMNAIFGDPCPGTSKKLTVHYIISVNSSCEVHHTNFAEHENVVLRRRLLHKQKATVTEGERGGTTVPRGVYLRRSQSMEEMTTAKMEIVMQQQRSQGKGSDEPSTSLKKRKRTNESSSWGLGSADSEVVLPLVLPFLQLQERVDCRRVSRVWKHIVRDWGIATIIDSNDQSITNFSRPFLRGILLHSYSSLHSLVLDGFQSLQKDDLHPALPNLRKLQRLDLSRCNNLDDSTIILLSEHVHSTLRVLYIKGLERVSDVGVKAICRCCSNLEVLDLSFVPLTDEAGVEIQNLSQLQALFMRDNYQLTDKSIDAIAAKCTKLSQLTLWGCIKMRSLEFRLFHGSSDKLENLSSSVPHLNHLHMRYCKRLTDDAVNAVANSLCHLHSLDLSFCTRLTATSIFHLLELRSESLTELRLKHCKQLQIGTQTRFDQLGRASETVGCDGRLIVNALRSHSNHVLSILDLRDCGGQPSCSPSSYKDTDPLVVGLKAIDFVQRVPGFFSRPARWSSEQQYQIDHINLQDFVDQELVR